MTTSEKTRCFIEDVFVVQYVTRLLFFFVVGALAVNGQSKKKNDFRQWYIKRKDPPDFVEALSTPIAFEQCDEEKDNYWRTRWDNSKRVKVTKKDKFIPVSQAAEQIGALKQPEKKRIVGCMIYTFHEHRQKLLDQLQTWALQCDKVYAFSNEKWEIPELQFTTIPIRPLSGKEDFGNLWMKLRVMWKHIAKIWKRDNLDFLITGGDDMFWIMPNTRKILDEVPDYQIHGDKHLMLGNIIDSPAATSGILNRKQGEVSGRFIAGAGYIVNLKTAETITTCTEEQWNYTVRAEDIVASECLRTRGFDPTLDPITEKHSHRFCVFEVCGTEDAILYHYVTGSQMFILYNSIYSDTDTVKRKRLCAPMPPEELPLLAEAVDVVGWSPAESSHRREL